MKPAALIVCCFVPLMGGTIEGHVTQPAAQATVGLTRHARIGQIADDVEQVLTDEDGKFEFTAVREGEWRVQAENAPEYDYKLNRPIIRSGSRPVTLSRRDTENVQILLASPFALDVSTDWGDDAEPDAVHPKV